MKNLASNRLRVATSVLSVVIGVVTLILNQDLGYIFNTGPFVFSTASITMILTGTALLLTLYVQGYFSKLEGIQREHSINPELIKEITAEIYGSRGLEQIRAELRQTFEDKFSSLSEEKIILSVQDSLRGDLEKKLKLESIELEIERLKRRISDESEKISRYGYINLGLGFITTFAVILFLGYSLLFVPEKFASPQDYLYHFIPRISLSVLIEIFSFFFLKLYKQSLEDIKYFNNERTNIELKVIAMKTSLITADNESLKEIIKSFANTERNYVLKNNESTIDLERSKQENEFAKNVLEKIGDQLGRLSK